MNRTRSIAYSFAVALPLFIVSEAPAEAFCRTTTTQPPAGYDVPSQGCFSQGPPLFQPSQCLPYRLFAKPSPVIPNDVLDDRLALAFATWTSPNTKCTPGITPVELPVSTDAEIVGYTEGETADSVIGVPATWTHSGSDMLALATVKYNITTGVILDADVEVNPTVKWSWTNPTPPDAVDLQTVLTHAVGHMLGLAHSATPEAVMFATLDPGMVKRTLDPDDQAAVCTVYPSRTQRLSASGLTPTTACMLAPGTASGTCADPNVTHGCTSAPASPASPGSANGPLFTVAVGAALVAIRRRRDKRAVAPAP